MLPFLAIGAALFAAFSFAVTRLGDRGRLAAWLGVIAFFAVGTGLVGFAYGVLMAIVGYIAGGMTCWLASGRYRLNLPPYATARQVLWFYSFRVICGMIFVFLIMPIFVLIPLSFNQEPYFSFTPGMLRFDPLAYSMRWYVDILQNGMVDPAAVVGWWSDMWSNAQWIRSIRNSFFHRLLGNDDLNCARHAGGRWIVLQRHAVAPAHHGLADIADDCAFGDHRFGALFLFFKCRLGQNLSWASFWPMRLWEHRL